MRFAAMGLRSRIFSGFGVLVALGLAMAGYGYYGLSNIASEGVKKDALAANVSRVLETSRMLETIRRAGTRYRIEASADALKDMEAAEARVAVLLAESAATAISEQQRAPTRC